MNRNLKRFLSFVIVLCVAFVCFIGSVKVSAASATKTYTFSEYTAGTQYAENEEHKLDDVLTLYTTQCHFTTQLRIYSSSTHDGYVVSNQLPGKILSIGVNAGNKADTLNVYGSTDGSTWTLVGGIATSTTYTEYTLAFTDVEYTYFKLDVAGTNQVRLTSLTIEYETTAPVVTVEALDVDYAEVGGTIALQATLANTTGTPTWSSSATDIATVDSDGVVTAKAMGTATITADVNGTTGTIDVKVYPVNGSELTVAEALTVCTLTGATNAPYTYSVTGVIEALEYNSTYDNSTLTINDGANTIQAYRMTGGSDLAEGDKIKITGTLIKYNNATAQFIAGATYTVIGDSAEVTAAKEALAAIKTYMSLGYKYSREEKVISAEAGSVTAQYTAASITKMVDGNNAETVGLDPLAFSVVATKGSASNNVGLNKAGQIRLYANSSSGNGNELTISSLTGATITSIEIAFGTTVGSFTVNGVEGSKDTTTYAINAESFTIKNTTSGASTQVYILSITINYSAAASDTVAEVLSEGEFRIRCGADLALMEIANVDNFGIQVTANGTTMQLTNLDMDDKYVYGVLSLGDLFEDNSRFAVDFTVEAYVVIDGVTYVSENIKTYSVAGLINEYNTLGYNVTNLYDYLTNNGLITE